MLSFVMCDWQDDFFFSVLDDFSVMSCVHMGCCHLWHSKTGFSDHFGENVIVLQCGMEAWLGYT